MRDKPIGTSYKPDNVYSVDGLPSDFQRVLVLPLRDPDGRELAPELSDAVLASLRRTARFEVVSAGHRGSGVAELPAESLLSANRPIPRDILAQARRLGANGILQVEFTHYRPFKPLQIGFRGRLFALNTAGQSGDVLWEIDELFDGGHRPVAIGARKYSESYIEQAFPLQSSYSSLMSPARFAGYVSLTAFETIPPRSASQPASELDSL